MHRIAVVMAGGSGERFWPASRATRPKQLLKLTDPNTSLLKEAVHRVEPLVGPRNTFVATGKIIFDAILESDVVAPANVFAEPLKRNTLGAVAWTIANLMARDLEDSVVAFVTADHKIENPQALRDCLQIAFDVAETTNGLVTIGIKPTHADTAFGYIELVEPLSADHGAVKSFHEKPNLDTAKQFLAAGNFLWNSGMFVWTVAAFLRELDQAQPEAARMVRKIALKLRNGEREEAEAAFGELPNLSIDYALMEAAREVFVVPATFGWDDVGSWDALTRALPKDASGNVSVGSVLFKDAAENVVYSEDKSTIVALLGVTGLIVSVTPDAVLVTTMDRAQEVRAITEALKEKGDPRV